MYVSTLLGLKLGLNVQLRVHVSPYFMRLKVWSQCSTTCTCSSLHCEVYSLISIFNYVYMYVPTLLGLKFGLNVQLRVYVRPYFVCARSKGRDNSCF